MLHYILKKTKQTTKFLEGRKEIPTCMLIKEKQRKLNMNPLERFMSALELLEATLKFARINTPKDPVLRYIARDVHIGKHLARNMQELGDFSAKKRSNELDLVKLPCVLMSSRLTGEMTTLHNFMSKLYKDLHATARTLLNNNLKKY